MLALYQALRTAITDAIQTIPGADPDGASYQIAVQDLVTQTRNILPGPPDLAVATRPRVLASLHPRAAPSSAPRKVKSPLSG